MNETDFRPLSEYALKVLRALADEPIPRQEINPGVVDRLTRESLAETVQLPSPYKTRKGRTCEHLQITEAGRKALAGGKGS